MSSPKHNGNLSILLLKKIRYSPKLIGVFLFDTKCTTALTNIHTPCYSNRIPIFSGFTPCRSSIRDANTSITAGSFTLTTKLVPCLRAILAAFFNSSEVLSKDLGSLVVGQLILAPGQDFISDFNQLNLYKAIRRMNQSSRHQTPTRASIWEVWPRRRPVWRRGRLLHKTKLRYRELHRCNQLHPKR